MLDINDFAKKQIMVFMPCKGDKLSFNNDNIVIKDSEGKTKYQNSCYRVFMVIVIGDCSITTALLRRARKFAFSICFMTYSFRVNTIVKYGLEGNTLLHMKQYRYEGNKIGTLLIRNKIINQSYMLNRIRNKSEFIKEGIAILDGYIERFRDNSEVERETLLGIEGNAARVYFSRLFCNYEWKGRKPRIKFDYINSLLDIGYTILFNFVDCLLQVYDFDVYKGVLHTDFYMRKSLVCDLMEPLRPIIDWRIKKGINLNQFKKEDFILIRGQCQLEYKKSASYSAVFLEDILSNKEKIFIYIRSYYRSFMKDKDVCYYPLFNLED